MIFEQCCRRSYLGRTHAFIASAVLVSLIYSSPLRSLAILSFTNELYSHFLLIPIVSVYLFYRERKIILETMSYSPHIGIGIIIIGILCFFFGLTNLQSLNQNDFLSICMLGFVTTINGVFLTFFGNQAYRKAIFSFLFLLFMVPLPLFILEPLIWFLQVMSAHAVHVVFELIGIPYIREGLVFEVPGIAIEVAKECSGIRSSLALFITSVVAGYMFLRTGWRRIFLALTVFPLTIFKNALRITTLALLAAYVDTSWITDSWLHSMGGKPFFIMALCFMFPVLWILHRSEKKITSPGRSEG